MNQVEKLKNILTRKDKEVFERNTVFHLGEYVSGPNQCGIFEYKNKWFSYLRDDRNDVIINGPFSEEGLVYVCALLLQTDDDFDDYYYSKEDKNTFTKQRFCSFEQIDTFLNSN